ncbi:MAG: GNAT family N-acetyltransferase [Defluviitaleaceae bacterium]|nr:GNAT family N-acetyltransferase [Defluviitaleaceae bacterium]
MIEKALAFLNGDRLLHMGLIFPIKRGTAEIIHADSNGVFINECESGAFMMSVKCAVLGKKLLDAAGRQELFCVCQESIALYLTDKFNHQKKLTCVQAVYEKSEPIPLQGSLDIRRLDVSHTGAVFEHYQYADYEYLKKRLENGGIYGGYVNGEMCGFVGTHAEGSIGILEVLEKYRKRGFGAELLGFMVNKILEEGNVPFSQIEPENEVSVRLHQRFGFTVTPEKLYWLFD